MSKKALVPINVLSSGVEPTGRYDGDVYFNSLSQSFFVYNGVTWLVFLPNTQPVTEDGGFIFSTIVSPISFIGLPNVLYVKKQINKIPKRMTKFVKY